MRLAPNDHTPQAKAVRLPQGQWYPPHHKRLCTWLAGVARQSGPKVAVFDWDNTCIFNDIGDATWRHQLDHLQLRLDPDAMRARLPERIDGITTLSNGLTLAALGQDIMEAYTALWPHMQEDTVHTVLASRAHRDFRAKMMHLITAMERTPELGAQASYRAQAAFLDGLEDADITRLTRIAWHATRSESVGTASWLSATPGQAGHVQQSFLTHIAIIEEMIDLIRALHDAEVQVYVISASAESVVRSIISTLQLPISASHVYGVRPYLKENEYPLTYRSGKARVIREYLPTPPLLVAGDANTDYEMLTEFAQTQVRLIINRNLDGDIRTLYEAPSDAQKPVTTLLQGRNDNLACFMPDFRTIPFGKHTPQEI